MFARVGGSVRGARPSRPSSPGLTRGPQRGLQDKRRCMSGWVAGSSAAMTVKGRCVLAASPTMSCMVPGLLLCALSEQGGDGSFGQPLGGGARGGADCWFGEGGSPQGLPPWGDRRTLQRDRVALAPAQARRRQINRDWRRAGLILPGQGRPIGRTCGRRPHPTLTAGLCNVPSPGAARHPLELSLCSVRARRRRLARPTTGRRGEGRCRHELRGKDRVWWGRRRGGGG